MVILDNTTKLFYGLLKEPELNLPEENDDGAADGEDGEKPKVKFAALSICNDLGK